MKKFLDLLIRSTKLLEIIIAITVIIGIIISMKGLFVGLSDLYLSNDVKNSFLEFLAIAFNILIGIEFLKMIFNYNVNTVIEVLLFAISRQLIVEHTGIYENCIGIISIMLLFAIRKFFFIPTLDKDKN
ncbi:MAG: hypothetical protein ACERKZ_15135 [Lachnotalea sp.]